MISRLRLPALTLAAVLSLGAFAGCGSSDKSDGTTETTAAAGGGSGDTSSAGGATTDETVVDGTGQARPAGDPCARISAEDMATTLGLDSVTTSDASVGPQSLCSYDNEAAYVSVEAGLVLPDFYNATKTPTQAAVAGVGDEAFGEESKGGASIVAKKGDRVAYVLISNGGGGPEAGNLSDGPASLEVAKQIATTLLDA